MIRFGVAIPNCFEGLILPLPFAKHDDLIHLGSTSEELGFDSAWVNDHVTTQRYVRSAYSTPPNYYEPMITLASMAAVTSKIRLGTGVIVLPLRHPVTLAKEATALDLYSGGRLILGVGLGAYKEEFEAMFPKIPVSERRLLLDEGIRALRLLLKERRASFEGKYFQFNDIELFPKPLQSPLPIYIGGNSPQGIERAARWGDGWLPAVLSPEEVRSAVETMDELTKKVGRSLSEIDVAPQLTLSIARNEGDAVSHFRRSRIYEHLKSLDQSTLKNQSGRFEERCLIGTPDKIIDGVGKYIDAGVTHFASLIFTADTVQEYVDGMTIFSREVMPSFR